MKVCPFVIQFSSLVPTDSSVTYDSHVVTKTTRTEKSSSTLSPVTLSVTKLDNKRQKGKERVVYENPDTNEGAAAAGEVHVRHLPCMPVTYLLNIWRKMSHSILFFGITMEFCAQTSRELQKTCLCPHLHIPILDWNIVKLATLCGPHKCYTVKLPVYDLKPHSFLE